MARNDKGRPTLPADAVIVGLWPERLVFETREGVPPNTPVCFSLVLEGKLLPLDVFINRCIVFSRDRRGYIFHAEIELDQLRPADRQIVSLFINKGRGAPQLTRLGN
ncbi:MAG: hypothetical protein MUF51_03225 [Vicinamibacteria bacterium]|jgi:hypothetical protein|nr:hypothetical protein [Vicinamibacteria bacterium]